MHSFEISLLLIAVVLSSSSSTMTTTADVENVADDAMTLTLRLTTGMTSHAMTRNDESEML